MTTPDYDADFYAWAQAQAAALRAKDWAALDLEHLAEEVEELRKTGRRGVRSTIANGRVLVQDDLEDIPSLTRELPELFI